MKYAHRDALHPLLASIREYVSRSTVSMDGPSATSRRFPSCWVKTDSRYEHISAVCIEFYLLLSLKNISGASIKPLMIEI